MNLFSFVKVLLDFDGTYLTVSDRCHRPKPQLLRSETDIIAVLKSETLDNVEHRLSKSYLTLTKPILRSLTGVIDQSHNHFG
ncbi:MAG: hypothetical protein IPN86_06280 [Saprospiraceae bacterium]|nr:hypothetical protein [Saprospiraceae bacterium]